MDINQLVQSVKLVDVRTIQYEARLELDPGTDEGLSSLHKLSGAGELAINLNPVSWGRDLETWFQAAWSSAQFRIVAAVAVLYRRESDRSIPESVRTEFLERVAIMAAYPYLRAHIQALAAELRLGNVTLDVLRPGEFAVSGPPSGDGPTQEP